MRVCIRRVNLVMVSLALRGPQVCLAVRVFLGIKVILDSLEIQVHPADPVLMVLLVIKVQSKQSTSYSS